MDAMKDLERLRKKHKESQKYRPPFPDLKEVNAPTLSNGFANTGFKRDPLAHRWKKGCEESAETIKEIQAKAKRVAPLVNKQGYSYISPETDATTIGRK
jgi:hypothetical protein